MGKNIYNNFENTEVINEITEWCIRNKISDVERQKLEKLFIRAIKGSKEVLYDSRNIG